jgi:hypothetical protein
MAMRDVSAHIQSSRGSTRRAWSCSRPLDRPLAGNHRLAAVRAHLLELAGDPAAAAEGHAHATQRTTNQPERDA